jgi:hypothetical protein
MSDLLRPRWRLRRGLAACAGAMGVAWGMAGCGGGSSNPFDNPSQIQNPAIQGGQKLSFGYFQKCIDPIFLAQLQINNNGVVSTNTCAGSGCHDTVTGTGGSFRVVPGAQPVDLTNPANTPDVVRQTDMYKNFYSAQGATVFGAPAQSRLFQKPLLLNILHGGGLVFPNDQDINARRIAYWISQPAPQGQDEFSFTPADPSGTCTPP